MLPRNAGLEQRYWVIHADYYSLRQVEVLKSNRPPASKLVWCLVVFLFPIIGLVIYWLFSDRAAHRTGSSYEPLG